jgi:hypothetical protein
VVSLLHSEREQRIAELIVTLSERDRDSIAACVRMLAAIAVLGKAMNKVNRYHCARVLREASDQIEHEPQLIC